MKNNNKRSTSKTIMSISNDFYQWLSGYLDGEGNFQVFRKKVVNTKGIITHYGVGVGFHLGLHTRDTQLLKELQQLFNGIGKLYIYEQKNEAHYAVTSIAHLKWLIVNVLDNCTFLTSHQSKRYQLLRHCVMNDIKRVETLEEFNELTALGDTFSPVPYSSMSQQFINNFIVGFINGEASFTTVPTGTAKFALEHTDSTVICMIHDHMRFSTNVYSPTQRSNRKVTYAISVTNSMDIAIVLDFIKSNYPLQGYKLIQFNSWVENHIGADWDYKQYLVPRK